MNENGRMEFTVCSVISVLAGIVLAIASGIAFYFGYIANTAALLWICFGMSAFVIAAILAAILLKGSGFSARSKCVKGFELILSGAVATLISSIMALCATLLEGSVAAALLIAIVTFFFTLIIAGIVCVFICLKNSRAALSSSSEKSSSGSSASGFECLR